MTFQFLSSQKNGEGLQLMKGENPPCTPFLVLILIFIVYYLQILINKELINKVITSHNLRSVININFFQIFSKKITVHTRDGNYPPPLFKTRRNTLIPIGLIGISFN